MTESIKTSLQSIVSTEEKLPEPDIHVSNQSEAQTLHRILGYNPSLKRYNHHENNPLDFDVTVVDETSMVDLEMMAKLLKATTPPQSNLPFPKRVIFLGDANQLPSVGAGSVLKEWVPEVIRFSPTICNTLKFHHPLLEETLQKYQSNKTTDLRDNVIQLVHSFRQRADNPQGKNILGIAQKVNTLYQNKTPHILFHQKSPSDEVIKTIPELNQFPFEKTYFLEQENNKRNLQEFIQFWIKHFFTDAWKKRTEAVYSEEMITDNHLELDELFEFYRKNRVLSTMRISNVGSQFINELFCLMLSQSNQSLFPGAPIMVQKNDYLHDLYNGDEGICLQIKNSKTQSIEQKIVFPKESGYQTFHPYQLAHADLAFATTIHKSQGSEFDHIAIILPNEPNNLLVKEMLYTAITRAKKSILILGSKARLEEAVLNKVNRISGFQFE